MTASMHPNHLPAVESEALHRLTARLATLDLDPGTVEILTAILTADIDLNEKDDAREVAGCQAER